LAVSLGVASTALAVAGVAASAYLTLSHYRADLLVCAVGGCHTVQQSRYAEVAGIPVALLGLGMYLAVGGLGIFRWRHPARAEVATMTAFALALAGTIFAAYLTAIEIWVIDAICQWCVLSALLTLGLLAVEGMGTARVFNAEDGGRTP
jgi:uncharacterized membrane protein